MVSLYKFQNRDFTRGYVKGVEHCNTKCEIAYRCGCEKTKKEVIDKFVKMCEEKTQCMFTTEQVDMRDILEIAYQLKDENK